MPNPYFNYNEDLLPGESVRSGFHDDRFEELESAFDLLPDPDKLRTGANTGATETGGVADNYVVENGTETTLVNFQQVVFIPGVTNTGPSTLDFNSGGAKPIKRNNGLDTQGGDLLAGIPVLVIWDQAGDRWVLSGATAAQCLSETRPPTIVEAGTARTVSAVDEKSVIKCTNAAAVSILFPNDTTENLPQGFLAHYHQHGEGKLTISAEVGVSITFAVGLSTRARYSSLSIYKHAPNEIFVFGDAG